MLAPFMVEHGANMNVVNERGQTPWLIRRANISRGRSSLTPRPARCSRVSAQIRSSAKISAAPMPRRRQDNDDANLVAPLRPVARGELRVGRRDGGSPGTGARGTADEIAKNQALVGRYCATCHSERLRSGDVVLQGVDLGDVAHSAETLEKVVRKLRSGTMPPPGAPRPDAATTANLVSFLESSLDRQALAHPNPGRPSAPHRLNRAIRTPSATSSASISMSRRCCRPTTRGGFDNISDVCRCRRCSPSAILRPRSASAASPSATRRSGDDGSLLGEQVSAPGRSGQRGSAVRLARRTGDSLLLPSTPITS